MKKKLAYLLSALILLLLVCAAPSLAFDGEYNTNYPLIFNEQGKALILNTAAQTHTSSDFQIIIPFVPLRSLGNYYGMEVHWQHPNAYINWDGKLITVRLGSKNIIIWEDGAETTIQLADSPFINEDNRLLISMQLFTDVLNIDMTIYEHGMWYAIQLGERKYEREQQGGATTTPWGEKL